MRKNKGITIVALVVTIVVLLILAGVSINLVLGNNGIIAKAKDAETKSAEASQNDLKGMNGLVSEMEGALAGNGSTGSGSGNGGAGGSGADTKVPAEATAETAPYFPDNTFTKKEGTIDTGLVIQDASGNEYVWVVVPRTTAVYATTGLGKTTFTDADYTSIENDLKEYTKTYRGSTSFITDTWYADDKNEGWLSETEYKTLKNSMLKSVYENGGFYVGRYEAGIAENRTGNTDKNSDGKYTIEGMPTPVTKADGYSDTYVADDKNVGWFADATAYNNLKNSMLKSIYENGGFYVGRYEAGIGTNRTSNIDKNSEEKYITPSTAPVTKADAYPYTYVTRTQAQNLASNVNSGTKTSSLMFGVQWDLVLAFMSKDTAKITSTDVLTKNSTTIGNDRDSVFQLSQTVKYATFSNWTLSSTWNPSTTPTINFVDSSRNKIAQSSDGNGILVTTGTSEKNKVMNIYDIAGNVWEWTLEKASDTYNPFVNRGGGCSRTGLGLPAACREYNSTDFSVGVLGFRVSLF